MVLTKFAKKLISLTLSLTLFITNGVLLYAAETNLWKERKASLELAQLQPFQSTPVFSPLSASSNIATQLKKQDFEQKIPSHLTKTQKNKILPILEALSTPHATLRGLEFPPNTDWSQVVIHLQDIHLHTEAQQNIAFLIKQLETKASVNLLMLEGAFDKVNIEPFHQLSKPDLIENVASFLLKENTIQGPLFAALTHQGPLNVVGVDDKDLYYQNVQAYQKSDPLKDREKSVLKDQINTLKTLKRKHYPEDLMILDQARVDYHAGVLSIGNYFSILIKETKNNYPAAQSFLSALALEKALDYRRVEHERNYVLQRLLSTLSQKEKQNFIDLSLAYKTKALTNWEFYRALQTLMKDKGLDLNKTPELKKYVEYVFLAESIQAENLFAELHTAEEEVFDHLTQTPEQKDLIKQSNYLILKKKLLDFALTQEEWGEYQMMTNSSSWTSEPEDRHPGESQGPDGSWIKTFQDDDIGRIEPSSFELFYELAEARDAAMASNVVEAFHKNNTNAAVLVSGGFHSHGIKETLLKEGVAVLNVVPRVTKVELDSKSSYLSVFSQAKTPLEKLFEGDTLFLVKPVGPGLYTTQTLTAILATLQGLFKTGVEAFQHFAISLLKADIQQSGTTVQAELAYPEKGTLQLEAELTPKGRLTKMHQSTVKGPRTSGWLDFGKLDPKVWILPFVSGYILVGFLVQQFMEAPLYLSNLVILVLVLVPFLIFTPLWINWGFRFMPNLGSLLAKNLFTWNGLASVMLVALAVGLSLNDTSTAGLWAMGLLVLGEKEEGQNQPSPASQIMQAYYQGTDHVIKGKVAEIGSYFDIADLEEDYSPLLQALKDFQTAVGKGSNDDIQGAAKGLIKALDPLEKKFDEVARKTQARYPKNFDYAKVKNILVTNAGTIKAVLKEIWIPLVSPPEEPVTIDVALKPLNGAIGALDVLRRLKGTQYHIEFKPIEFTSEEVKTLLLGFPQQLLILTAMGMAMDRINVISDGGNRNEITLKVSLEEDGYLKFEAQTTIKNEKPSKSYLPIIDQLIQPWNGIVGETPEEGRVTVRLPIPDQDQGGGSMLVSMLATLTQRAIPVLVIGLIIWFSADFFLGVFVGADAATPGLTFLVYLAFVFIGMALLFGFIFAVGGVLSRRATDPTWDIPWIKGIDPNKPIEHLIMVFDVDGFLRDNAHLGDLDPEIAELLWRLHETGRVDIAAVSGSPGDKLETQPWRRDGHPVGPSFRKAFKGKSTPRIEVYGSMGNHHYDISTGQTIMEDTYTPQQAFGAMRVIIRAFLEKVVRQAKEKSQQNLANKLLKELPAVEEPAILNQPFSKDGLTLKAFTPIMEATTDPFEAIMKQIRSKTEGIDPYIHLIWRGTDVELLTKQGDGWNLDGLSETFDLKDALTLRALPEEERTPYSGVIYAKISKVGKAHRTRLFFNQKTPTYPKGQVLYVTGGDGRGDFDMHEIEEQSHLSIHTGKRAAMEGYEHLSPSHVRNSDGSEPSLHHGAREILRNLVESFEKGDDFGDYRYFQVPGIDGQLKWTSLNEIAKGLNPKSPTDSGNQKKLDAFLALTFGLLAFLGFLISDSLSETLPGLAMAGLFLRLKLSDSHAVLSQRHSASQQVFFRGSPQKVFDEQENFIHVQKMNPQQDNTALGGRRVLKNIAEAYVPGDKNTSFSFDQLINLFVRSRWIYISDVLNIVTAFFKNIPYATRGVGINQKFHSKSGGLAGQVLVAGQKSGIENARLNIFGGNGRELLFHRINRHARGQGLKNDVNRRASSLNARFPLLDVGIHRNMFFQNSSIYHEKSISAPITEVNHRLAGLPAQSPIQDQSDTWQASRLHMPIGVLGKGTGFRLAKEVLIWVGPASLMLFSFLFFGFFTPDSLPQSLPALGMAGLFLRLKQHPTKEESGALEKISDPISLVVAIWPGLDEKLLARGISRISILVDHTRKELEEFLEPSVVEELEKLLEKHELWLKPEPPETGVKHMSIGVFHRVLDDVSAGQWTRMEKHLQQIGNSTQDLIQLTIPEIREKSRKDSFTGILKRGRGGQRGLGEPSLKKVIGGLRKLGLRPKMIPDPISLLVEAAGFDSRIRGVILKLVYGNGVRTIPDFQSKTREEILSFRSGSGHYSGWITYKKSLTQLLEVAHRHGLTVKDESALEKEPFFVGDAVGSGFVYTHKGGDFNLAGVKKREKNLFVANEGTPYEIKIRVHSVSPHPDLISHIQNDRQTSVGFEEATIEFIKKSKGRGRPPVRKPGTLSALLGKPLSRVQSLEVFEKELEYRGKAIPTGTILITQFDQEQYELKRIYILPDGELIEMDVMPEADTLFNLAMGSVALGYEDISIQTRGDITFILYKDRILSFIKNKNFLKKDQFEVGADPKPRVGILRGRMDGLGFQFFDEKGRRVKIGMDGSIMVAGEPLTPKKVELDTSERPQSLQLQQGGKKGQGVFHVESSGPLLIGVKKKRENRFLANPGGPFETTIKVRDIRRRNDFLFDIRQLDKTVDTYELSLTLEGPLFDPEEGFPKELLNEENGFEMNHVHLLEVVHTPFRVIDTQNLTRKIPRGSILLTFYDKRDKKLARIVILPSGEIVKLNVNREGLGSFNLLMGSAVYNTPGVEIYKQGDRFIVLYNRELIFHGNPGSTFRLSREDPLMTVWNFQARYDPEEARLKYTDSAGDLLEWDQMGILYKNGKKLSPDIKPPGSHQQVFQALSGLSRPVTAEEIGRQLNISEATARRDLSPMVKQGLVEKNGQGIMALYTLSQKAHKQFPLILHLLGALPKPTLTGIEWQQFKPLFDEVLVWADDDVIKMHPLQLRYAWPVDDISQVENSAPWRNYWVRKKPTLKEIEDLLENNQRYFGVHVLKINSKTIHLLGVGDEHYLVSEKFLKRSLVEKGTNDASLLTLHNRLGKHLIPFKHDFEELKEDTERGLMNQRYLYNGQTKNLIEYGFTEKKRKQREPIKLRIWQNQKTQPETHTFKGTEETELITARSYHDPSNQWWEAFLKAVGRKGVARVELEDSQGHWARWDKKINLSSFFKKATPSKRKVLKTILWLLLPASVVLTALAMGFSGSFPEAGLAASALGLVTFVFEPIRPNLSSRVGVVVEGKQPIQVNAATVREAIEKALKEFTDRYGKADGNDLRTKIFEYWGTVSLRINGKEYTHEQWEKVFANPMSDGDEVKIIVKTIPGAYSLDLALSIHPTPSPNQEQSNMVDESPLVFFMVVWQPLIPIPARTAYEALEKFIKKSEKISIKDLNYYTLNVWRMADLVLTTQKEEELKRFQLQPGDRIALMTHPIPQRKARGRLGSEQEGNTLGVGAWKLKPSYIKRWAWWWEAAVSFGLPLVLFVPVQILFQSQSLLLSAFYAFMVASIFWVGHRNRMWQHKVLRLTFSHALVGFLIHYFWIAPLSVWNLNPVVFLLLLTIDHIQINWSYLRELTDKPKLKGWAYAVFSGFAHEAFNTGILVFGFILIFQAVGFLQAVGLYATFILGILFNLLRLGYDTRGKIPKLEDNQLIYTASTDKDINDILSVLLISRGLPFALITTLVYIQLSPFYFPYVILGSFLMMGALYGFLYNGWWAPRRQWPLGMPGKPELTTQDREAAEEGGMGQFFQEENLNLDIESMDPTKGKPDSPQQKEKSQPSQAISETLKKLLLLRRQA